MPSHVSPSHPVQPRPIVSDQSRRDARRAVVGASVGNGLEWFDLTVYGTFAVTISKLYFPTDNPTSSLLLTFLSFAVAFLVRPLGAVVIGRFSDRRGRKSALMLSIMIMFVGTLIVAFAPTAQMIGVTATVLIVVARMLQGFSAGGEFASATAFLVEYAPDRKSFYGSWQVATTGVAIFFAGGFGFVLYNYLSERSLDGWGWRLPFLFALLIGPVGMYIRRTLNETPEFRDIVPSESPVKDTFTKNYGQALTLVGIIALCSVSIYMALYMPTYAIVNLEMNSGVAHVSTLAFGFAVALSAPFFGGMADRFGAIRVMLPAAALSALLALPLFALLIGYSYMGVLIGIELIFGVLAAAFFGPVPALMVSLFPVESRTTGMSIAYNTAVMVFGGFAPFILTALIAATGSTLAPSFYLLAIALLSLTATIVASKKYGVR